MKGNSLLIPSTVSSISFDSPESPLINFMCTIVQHCRSDQKKINKRENLHGFWLFSSHSPTMSRVGGRWNSAGNSLHSRDGKAMNKKAHNSSKSTPFSQKSQVGTLGMSSSFLSASLRRDWEEPAVRSFALISNQMIN